MQFPLVAAISPLNKYYTTIGAKTKNNNINVNLNVNVAALQFHQFFQCNVTPVTIRKAMALLGKNSFGHFGAKRIGVYCSLNSCGLDQSDSVGRRGLLSQTDNALVGVGNRMITIQTVAVFHVCISRSLQALEVNQHVWGKNAF